MRRLFIAAALCGCSEASDLPLSDVGAFEVSLSKDVASDTTVILDLDEDVLSSAPDVTSVDVAEKADAESLNDATEDAADVLVALDTSDDDALGTDVPDAADTGPLLPTTFELPGPIVEPPPSFQAEVELPGSFAEGVSSGDPAPDGAVVWGRYEGPATVTLKVVEDGTDAPAWEGPVTPAEDGILQVTLTGLTPDRGYHYAFFLSGDKTGRSPVGHFRTAPPDGALGPVRILHTGDAKEAYAPYEMGPFMAGEEGAAFWIFNGDTVYADGSENLEDYREKYRENWQEGNLAEVRAALPYTHTWDDHEFKNNFVPWDFPLLNVARQAYFEYHPTRVNAEDPNRLWRSVRWGKTVEVLVLDCRTERDQSKVNYLSPAQFEWLETRLLESDAVFKLIVTSAPIGTFFLSADDRWEGYPASRERIFDFIQDNAVDNVYWLAADFHATVLHRLDYGGWEFIAGPIGMTLLPIWNLLSGQPGVDFASGDFDNYHVIDLDPDAGTLTLTVKDEDGKSRGSFVYPHD